MVQVGADGTARVYDVGTGALLATLPNPGAPLASYLAYEGQLFRWRPEEKPQQVWR